MKHILLVTALIFAVSSFASEQVSKRKISKIQIYKTGVYVHLETPIQNADDCTHAAAELVLGLNINDVLNERLYSAILAAEAAGREIGFGVTGCLTYGAFNVPSIYRVDF